MIVIIKQDSTWDELHPLLRYCQENGIEVQETYGFHLRMLNLVGDTPKLDLDRILAFDAVENVHRLLSPYTLAGRGAHPEDSVVRIGSAAVGGGSFLLIAGPGSVETEEQILETARAVKQAGATMLRGGAYKPRYSPYAFQGLQQEGIRLLVQAGREVGLPVITEIMETAQLPLFADVDVIQVGTRNMQNYELLKELAHCKKPVLLKRGLSSRVEELLLSAEYLMADGNADIILCERGIRTFETVLNYTLDISAVPVVKELSHLPIIVDPCHGAGRRKLVPPLALAATAAGADGLILDVHCDPQNALSDGHRALTPADFQALCAKVSAVRGCL